MTPDLFFGFLLGLSCGAALALAGNFRACFGDALTERPVPTSWGTVDETSPRPLGAVPVSHTDRSENDSAPTPLPALGRRAVVVPMRTAAEHAAALLDFLQSPGGMVGEITADEIAASYSDLMLDLEWHPRPWPSVAKALRGVLGDARKTYGYRDGQRVRVWRIPPATKSPAPLQQAA